MNAEQVLINLVNFLNEEDVDWDCGEYIDFSAVIEAENWVKNNKNSSNIELEQRVRLKYENLYGEVGELLELIQSDGEIHDLDQYKAGSNITSTSGEILLELMQELEKLRGLSV